MISMTNNRKISDLGQFDRICIFAPHHPVTQQRFYREHAFLGFCLNCNVFNSNFELLAGISIALE